MKNNLFIPRRIENRERIKLKDIELKYNLNFEKLSLKEHKLFLNSLDNELQSAIILWSNKTTELEQEQTINSTVNFNKYYENAYERLTNSITIFEEYTLLKKLYKKRIRLTIINVFKRIFLWQ
jgi:hypothetical protein